MHKFLLLLLLSLSLFALELVKPKVYQGDENITGWVMSEKLDGIRGYWDGKKLYTRAGKEINAPSEFTSNFPPFELDGELWIGRGEFEEAQNTIMDKTPSADWDKVTYNIFEVPNSDGNLTSRLEMAQKWFLANPNPHIKIIEQIVCRDTAHLNQFLENVIESGGEGVVIRDANTTYHTGRSADILKVKKFEDMEGRVIAVNISKKTGKLGSVKLRLESGVEFKLGNGFHGLLAKNPPKIGDIVTFKYYGFTSNGVPRFASFMRIRRD